MATSQARACSVCLHWQPYPNWENVGVCDCPPSRNYDRMTNGSGGPCEYFSLVQPAVGPVVAAAYVPKGGVIP